MKILSWNILHGGGSRVTDIVNAISEQNADVVCLQEFRHGKSMQPLCSGLHKAGFAYSHTPPANKAITNTIAIFSKGPITTTDHYSDSKGTVRCSEALLPTDDARIIAVSFPHKKEQIPLFETLLALSEDCRSGRSIIIGDFNSGIPFEDSETKTFYATHLFQALQKQGWIDSWRSRYPKAREYSWFSTQKGNGFRYDHALASKAFDLLITNVSYDHSVREQGLSDHSLLVVEANTGTLVESGTQ